MSSGEGSARAGALARALASAGTLWKQVPATLRLVLRADRRGFFVMLALTPVAALLPAAIAYVGKLIIDAVVLAARGGPGSEARVVFGLVGLELGLMLVSLVTRRGLSLTRELVGANLGRAVNLEILNKALTLELRHFEDAQVYDKMQNARREASSRPLSLFTQTLAVVENSLSLFGVLGLLFGLSPYAALVLLLASTPSFIAEAHLAGESFRLHSWRAPEGRKLNYLEWILTRDSHVKEVKLFDLGPLVLGRYQELFTKFFEEDRRLARRRALAGLLLGALSLLAFYGCYAFVAWEAARGRLSLGDLALYLAVFRQGQSSFQAVLTALGAMYADALFMSNLFLFLELPTSAERPRVSPPRAAPRGRDNAIELRGVAFRYPGQDGWALRGLDLTIAPGEKLALVGANGAGKTTLIKLLLRLYEPTEGEILYGGVDLRDMDVRELRSRIGAVYQDFVRYQFSVGENVGLGDVSRLSDLGRIREAVERGGATALVEGLPKGLDTVLGGWFEAGQELSGGQWQKLAVSRAFMRDAEVLILDEPTANIDAEAEHELFQRFRALAQDRTALIISHRFSTVRVADRIAVLQGGRVAELGTHAELVASGGVYSRLFELQAQGYRD